VAGSVEAQGAAPTHEPATAADAVDAGGTLRAVIQPWGIQVRGQSAGRPARRVWHAMSDSLFGAYDAVERDRGDLLHGRAGRGRGSPAGGYLKPARIQSAAFAPSGGFTRSAA
jgi:hypothetical protein